MISCANKILSRSNNILSRRNKLKNKTRVSLPTEAYMDPRNIEIKSPRPNYFMLTCLGIPRHDDKKYVNMST